MYELRRVTETAPCGRGGAGLRLPPGFSPAATPGGRARVDAPGAADFRCIYLTSPYNSIQIFLQELRRFTAARLGARPRGGRRPAGPAASPWELKELPAPSD
jgi:hypothetical protein